MKPSMLLLAPLIFTANVFGEPEGEPVVIGSMIYFESKILEASPKLVIGKPVRYDADPETRYPVLFVLDGPAHFHHTTGVTEYLGHVKRLPELIVVALDNVDRNKNLTPPSEVEWESTPSYGGANEFLSFIRDELIPWVDTNYRTLDYRVLIGHSYGGLFSLHTMITSPDTFDAFIMISPSLYWNNQGVVDQAEAFLKQQKEFNKDLYITMGNESPRGVRKLTGVLDEIAPKGLRWDFRLMPEENHGSVPYRSTHQGLSAIFADWYLQDPNLLFDIGGVAAVKTHYAKLSERLGFERTMPRETINDIAHNLFANDRLEDVASLLEQTPGTYLPELYGNLAWQYTKREDTDTAAKYYKILADMSPGNTNAREQVVAAGGEVSLPNVSVTKETLERYSGLYYLPPKLGVTVNMEDEALTIEIKGMDKAKLIPMSQTRFYTEGSDYQYEFLSDEEGNVDALVLYLKSSVSRTKRVNY